MPKVTQLIKKKNLRTGIKSRYSDHVHLLPQWWCLSHTLWLMAEIPSPRETNPHMPETARLDSRCNPYFPPLGEGQRLTEHHHKVVALDLSELEEKKKRNYDFKAIHTFPYHWPGSLWRSWAGSNLANWCPVLLQWQPRTPWEQCLQVSSPSASFLVHHRCHPGSEVSGTLLFTSVSLSVKWKWSSVSCPSLL